MSKARPDDPRPLSEPVFQILLALVDGPRHGLGIADEVEQRTDGRVVLGVSTLYAVIKRLREGRIIEEVDTPPGADEDPRRRYYRLTGQGLEMVRSEAMRLERLVRQVRGKNVLPEAAS